MKKEYFLLSAILVFFFITRLYKINEIPLSVYWDEASIGYNAYSIVQTGRDEWGDLLPLHFRAFGEFKLPVYVYATAISVKLFGLNEFSVRLPAVLFSLGVVVLTYFLAKRLWGNETIGLLSSFFISVSPWFFIFSRTGYEATAGLMFFILGIYLFLHVRERIFFPIFSILSFILSIYSYNSFRIIVPLTLIILVAFYYDTLVYHSKAKILIVVSIVLLLFSFIPIIRLIKSDSGSIRFQTVGILSITNKSELLVKFTQNYLAHFSPEFLFFNGDKNLRSQQKGFGQMYLPELLLFLLGVINIVNKKLKSGLLALLLLLIGSIPAAMTKESPHALRAISMIPFISMVAAAGGENFQMHFKRRNLINLAVVIIFLLFFINYFINFINVYPVQAAADWQYGYKKIFTDFKEDLSKYDRVIISDAYAQPYIFALFYLQYNPSEFRSEVKYNPPDKWGFSTVESFGKFELRPVKISNLPDGHLLIFASRGEKFDNIQEQAVVRSLDNTIAFYVYDYQR